VLSKCVNELGE
jgi:ubiquitin carboxyl-terminal hydrolase 25/28